MKQSLICWIAALNFFGFGRNNSKVSCAHNWHLSAYEYFSHELSQRKEAEEGVNEKCGKMFVILLPVL
jgi:hypothetical protein